MVDAGEEIRASAGDEMRAEAEAVEAAAARLRLRSRRITDVAVELLHRGDVVYVHLDSGPVVGRMSHAAGDLATLDTRAGARLHLNLSAGTVFGVAPEDQSGPGAGRRQGSPLSFRALLRSLDLDGRPVRIATSGPLAELTGTIAAVAPDHIVVAGVDMEWFVPLSTVTAVWE